MAKESKAEREKRLAERRAYAKEYYAKRKAAKAAEQNGVAPVRRRSKKSGIEIMADVERDASDIRAGLKRAPWAASTVVTAADLHRADVEHARAGGTLQSEAEEVLLAMIRQHGIGLVLEALENACASVAREARTAKDRATVYRALAGIVELEGALP